MRKIESLPEAQVYQVLDYIEFLESRYASDEAEKGPSGLQRLAEGIEDRLRGSSFNPSNLREAFQVVAAADRALSGVARAGRQLMDELAGGSADGEDPEGAAASTDDERSKAAAGSTDRQGSKRTPPSMDDTAAESAAPSTGDVDRAPAPDEPHDR
ncbi:MAG: hypothetical protein OXH51_08335 [Gemmatimonadetes bacterium]|nr:hypothetical protein [Gemmatimonadota bacterium]MCY3611528.1 hypothetical protein [Gemmatimonadota bacterium]MCY3677611.1 hypothetical protein [Gemmatimonadota bacterium]